MIDQKVVVVTGGTQGIGYEIAAEFLRHNFFVVICSRHIPETSLFPDNLESVLAIPCDISDSEDREKFISEIQAHTERIDILVNNAGVAPEVRRNLLEMTEESYERLMKINLQGPFFSPRKLLE